jgi:hypothetical protein
MKGSPRSRARGSQAVAPAPLIKRLAFSKTIEVDGATGVGFGAVVLGGLPVGNILFLGAVSYVQLTKLSAAGVQDTFDGDYSIGTAPTADATLAAGDIDLIPSTPLGAATAGVSPRVRATHTAAIAGTVYDNTDGSLELNLNVLIDDANISANDQTLTAAGVLHLVFAVLGDD